jgi:hypothetical protein
MPQIKVNAMSFAHLVRELLAGEYTCEELAEKTGLHYVTVLHYTREMYRTGAVHICAWRMNNHRMYVKKVYKIGDYQDSPKPRKALTHAERSLRYREKKRNDLRKV